MACKAFATFWQYDNYVQVQQYKHERECNAIIGQMREDKIMRLENLMDGVLPTEDFMEEEFLSVRNENEV